MTPRSPLKPGVDPISGMPSRHDHAHNAHAKQFPSSALDSFDSVGHSGGASMPPSSVPPKDTKKPATVAPEEVLNLTDADLVEEPQTIEPDSTMVLVGNRSKLKTLLEKIETAPKRGISEAITTWRQIIKDAVYMPEIAPELHKAITARATGLKDAEGTLAPADRVALNAFIDHTLRNLSTAKKEGAVKKTPTANPLVFVTTWKELVTVTQQITQRAETDEERKSISRSVIQKALDLTLKSKTSEEWSEWGDHLFSFLPKFKDNQILTLEEAQKYCEKFIKYGIDQLGGSTNALEIMKWNGALKAKLESAQKAELMPIKIALQTVVYIDHLRDTMLLATRNKK